MKKLQHLPHWVSLTIGNTLKKLMSRKGLLPTRNLWCTRADSIRDSAGYKGIPVILTEYKIDEKTSTSPTLSQLPIGNTLKKLDAKEGSLPTRNLWRTWADSIRYGVGYKGKTWLVPIIITEYKIDDETLTSPTLSQLTYRKHAQKLMPKKVHFIPETLDAHEQTL
jgi:hypothetical protein